MTKRKKVSRSKDSASGITSDHAAKEIRAGLREIALREILADANYRLPHDMGRTVSPPPTKGLITWKCMPNCLKCRIEAALKGLADRVCEGCVSDGKEPHDQSICDKVSQTGNDGVNESFPE